jgi:hypothetical protein
MAEFRSFVLQDPSESVFHMERPEDTRIALYITPADLGILAGCVASGAAYGRDDFQPCAVAVSAFFEEIYNQLTPAEQALLRQEPA